MDKKRKSKTSSFTVKSLMNLNQEDILKMSLKELRKASHVLFSAANKRIKRLQEAGIENTLKDYGGKKFSTKISAVKFNESEAHFVKRLKNETISEFQRARSYLSRETSSLRGYHKLEKWKEDFFGDENNVPVSVFFEIYGALINENGVFAKYKYKTWDVIREEAKNGNDDVQSISAKVIESLINSDAIPPDVSNAYEVFEFDPNDE